MTDEPQSRWQALQKNRHDHALQRHEQQLEKDKQAVQDEHLSPEELDQELKTRIALAEHQQAKPPEDVLVGQLYTLDRVFSTALHQAGLGRQNTLCLEALKTGLLAQKLCRQTYNALHPPGHTSNKKQDKQSNEK